MACQENESLDKLLCGQGNTCPTHSEWEKLLKRCDTQLLSYHIGPMHLFMMLDMHRFTIRRYLSPIIQKKIHSRNRPTIYFEV